MIDGWHLNTKMLLFLVVKKRTRRNLGPHTDSIVRKLLLMYLMAELSQLSWTKPRYAAATVDIQASSRRRPTYRHIQETYTGWCIKNATGTLWHISKMVTPRVKAQSRGKNNRSRALKWDIVHLYGSNNFENTTKSSTKSQILKNIKKTILLVLSITSKVFEL